MKKKKGRYKVEESYSSDCFMGGDTSFHIIDLETGYTIKNFKRDESRRSSGSIESVKIQGNKVLVKNYDGTTRRYTIKDDDVILNDDSG
jgi:hypothetical protein